MATQFADAELVDPKGDHDSIGRSLLNAGRTANDHERLRPARGIIIAVMICIPFWALIGLTIYRLL